MNVSSRNPRGKVSLVGLDTSNRRRDSRFVRRICDALLLEAQKIGRESEWIDSFNRLFILRLPEKSRDSHVGIDR